MSKISNLLRNIANKIDHKPPEQIKGTTSETQGLEKITDQFKPSENITKNNTFISQVKEEVLDPLKDFTEKHPNLSTIITAMFAGGVSGILAKKAEEKKEITAYMESMQNFIGNVERRGLCEKIALLSVPSGVIIPLLLTSVPHIGLHLMSAAMSSVFVIGTTALMRSRIRVASKDRKFLMTGPHKFAAISTSGDKLLFCDINKKKPVPRKTIPLDTKATHLSFDHNSENFYVHQDGKSTLFSLSGEKITEYNTVM